jgi:hypothetical protein
MTDYLFARPSFLSGIASLADLAGTAHAYNRWQTAAETDAWALYSDWVAVGNDLRAAIKSVAAEIEGSV